MGLFNSKLRYEQYSTKRIILTSPLIFEDDGILVIVPVGFKSDGMSIPKWARWFQKPFGFGLEAGIIHDFILERKEFDLTFLEANDIFDNCLKALGMGWWHRNILELACNFNGIIIHGNKKPNNWDEEQS